MNGLKGLILKDLYLVRIQILIVAIVLAVYIVMALISSGGGSIGTFTGTYSVVVMSLLPITILNFDEKSKWGRYSAAMPVSRRANVLSKYIIMIVLSVINAAVIGLVYTLSKESARMIFIVFILAASLTTGSVVTALGYKFGSTNARFIFTAVIFVAVISAVAVAGGISISFGNELGSGLTIAALIFLAASALVCLASFMISAHIYENKDLEGEIIETKSDEPNNRKEK